MSPTDREWSLKVRSKEIIPVLFNALLFVGPVFQNVILRVAGNTLTAYSGDGYVLIKTSCEVEAVDEFTVVLSEDDTEKLLDFSKKVKDLIRNPGYVNIYVDQHGRELVANESGTEENPGQDDLTINPVIPPELTKKVIKITEHDYENDFPSVGNIRILPDRLSGMWRLKVPESMKIRGITFPMDWKYFESPHNPGQTIAVVKHGPGTILVVAGLHKVLEEKYPDVAEKCLWKTSIREDVQLPS